jgi:hypothetical protein
MLRAMIAIQTYGLLSYIGECAWYWAFMSVVHIVLFALGVGVLALALRFRRGQFRSWFVRWALFSVCLFITAGLASGLWSCLVFGRLYWSTDYIFDFTPFWPVTQRTLDHSFGGQVGGLLGISLLQLQALWLLFATITWGAAALLYRFFLRRNASGLATQRT